jgi:hypothetical protein
LAIICAEGLLMRHKLLVGVLAGLQLSGCASNMTGSECQLADWHAVGYEDGSQGRPTDAFGRHRRDCAEHGVAPDFKAYESGRDAGLREYCQESRGFEQGSNGHAYHGVCPADLEARFLQGYNSGHELYRLESSLQWTQQRIANDERRIRQIELDVTAKMTEALTPGATVEDRARLLVETKQLAEERGTLGGEIKDLQAKRGTLELQLAKARDELVSQR